MFVHNEYQGVIYVNGVSVCSQTGSQMTSLLNADLVLGADYRGDCYYLQGTMDHVNIYSSVLSQSQITALYNSYK